MLVLGVELIASGEEVGGKIGNPVNVEVKPEYENANKPSSSAATYQSKSIIIMFLITFRMFDVYLMYLTINH